MALQLGPLPIRWYSLAYIGGLAAGWWYLIQLLKNSALWPEKGAPITRALLDDVIFWVAIGVMAGGRLGYVLFYEPAMLLQPWQPILGFLPFPPALMLWQGGMSFHGGLIGVTLAGFLFSRKYKLNALSLGDLFACAAPIGLFFGRIANFINAELYGRPWDGAWAMVFPTDPAPAWRVIRASSMKRLWEGIVLFIIIRIATHSFGLLKRPGAAIGLFLAGYAASRIFVENFREPDAHLPDFPLGLTMGMMLSLPDAGAGPVDDMAYPDDIGKGGRFMTTPTEAVETTPLEERLIDLIKLKGPITVADYMADALGHPHEGYYMRQTSIGAEGDFTTAPEISQVFGELIGLWLVEAWRGMGSPKSFNLVELGPGRGVLMADILRAARLRPEFTKSAMVWLLETSGRLRHEQQKQLRGSEIKPFWADEFADIPPGPSLIVANEFFDCLPIRQFERVENGWRERLVGLDPDGKKLAFVLGRTPPPPDIGLPDISESAPGDIFEISPETQSAVTEICASLTEHGGHALIIDYGHMASGFGETLQAVRNHQYWPPLASRGAQILPPM